MGRKREPLIDRDAVKYEWPESYVARVARMSSLAEAEEEQWRRSVSGLDGRPDSAFEHDRQAMRGQGSSWFTFFIDSFVLMFGATGLAYAMGQMGWGWGVFWLSFSTVSTYLSGHVLGALCIETGAGTYGEVRLSTGRPVPGRPDRVVI